MATQEDCRGTCSPRYMCCSIRTTGIGGDACRLPSYMSAVPIIEPEFAYRIAGIYVSVYKTAGFDAAQVYLDHMTRGNSELRSHLIPFIVELGEKTK